MRLTLTGVLLIGLLGLAVFTQQALRSPSNVAAASSEGNAQVQLEVVQLPTDRGVIPVAIQGEKISVNPDNGSRQAFFVVKNNTDKNINAISVAVAGRVEHDGKEFSTIGYITKNTLIHPDIREYHHQMPLGPGQEWSFETDPLDTEAGDTVRGLTLQIDYVDFEDQTNLGPNKYGSKIVINQRTGAAKYKAWLVRKYAESGRSVGALIPLLNSQALPEELDFADHERSGARVYQTHLLKAYQQYGAAEVEKYLNR